MFDQILPKENNDSMCSYLVEIFLNLRHINYLFQNDIYGWFFYARGYISNHMIGMF